MRFFFPVIFLIYTILATSIPGLALDPDKKITQYIHDSWGLEDGLPQLSARTFFQGRDGYVWLGTLEGFVRFDGIRFELYDKRKVPQLTDNKITVLYEDLAGNLWIGTEDGGLTRMKDHRFVTFTTKEGLG
ncbi:MAG: histidine kinase, partial [bacterium]|nr:histidine kinase [bacterium]